MTSLAALVLDAAAWVAADEANDNATHADDQGELDALIGLEKLRAGIVQSATAINAVTREDLRDKARICIAVLRTALTGDADLLDIDRTLLASMLSDATG